jgi:hypothetical protein
MTELPLPDAIRLEMALYGAAAVHVTTSGPVEYRLIPVSRLIVSLAEGWTVAGQDARYLGHCWMRRTPCSA